jgi:uroporphyrinogen-III synthase
MMSSLDPNTHGLNQPLFSQGPLKNVVIAVTRPIDQAKRLTALIEAAGGSSMLFPLIAIAPLEDYSAFEASIANIHEVDWAIFISTNAVQIAMPRLIKKLNGFSQTHAQANITTQNLHPLKFAAIGPTTAEALMHQGSAIGLQNVLVPSVRFDSEALLNTPEMQAIANQRVVIFRGVGGREVLAETLKKRGAHVTFAESYHRINPQTDDTLLARAVKQQACHALVVTSSEAMRHLIQLTHHADWLKSIPICVNHARIKEEASGLGLNISVAQAPGDEAMLACLINALNKAS